ncbi:MAG: hypothetical protein RL653_672 [Pseudomonadota bacterium]
MSVTLRAAVPDAASERTFGARTREGGRRSVASYPRDGRPEGILGTLVEVTR